jgi:hypothetical protein
MFLIIVSLLLIFFHVNADNNNNNNAALHQQVKNVLSSNMNAKSPPTRKPTTKTPTSQPTSLPSNRPSAEPTHYSKYILLFSDNIKRDGNLGNREQTTQTCKSMRDLMPTNTYGRCDVNIDPIAFLAYSSNTPKNIPDTPYYLVQNYFPHEMLQVPVKSLKTGVMIDTTWERFFTPKPSDRSSTCGDALITGVTSMRGAGVTNELHYWTGLSPQGIQTGLSSPPQGSHAGFNCGDWTHADNFLGGYGNSQCNDITAFYESEMNCAYTSTMTLICACVGSTNDHGII